MNRALLTVIAGSLLLMGWGQSQEGPEAVVKGTVSEMLQLLYQKKYRSAAARDQALRQALHKRLSWEVIVRRAVGRNWKKLSSSEQKEVVRLTSELVIKAYTSRFSGSRPPKVVYQKPKLIAHRRVEMASSVSIDGERYAVSYRLIQEKDRWILYDLLVEGVSMVSNYRKQFDEHFRSSNGQALIVKLRNKMKEFNS